MRLPLMTALCLILSCKMKVRLNFYKWNGCFCSLKTEKCLPHNTITIKQSLRLHGPSILVFALIPTQLFAWQMKMNVPLSFPFTCSCAHTYPETCWYPCLSWCSKVRVFLLPTRNVDFSFEQASLLTFSKMLAGLFTFQLSTCRKKARSHVSQTAIRTPTEAHTPTRPYTCPVNQELYRHIHMS